jgi:hypothetical protein
MFRVRISTDANRLSYTFAGRRVPIVQRRAIKHIWVRAPQRPGRHRLIVRVYERRAVATVVVRGPRR